MKIGKKVGLLISIIILFGAAGTTVTMGTINEKTVIRICTTRGYIQSMIDNASDGDTILIPSGTYQENIIINKSISLIGENKNTTIIDGNKTGAVVNITADNVTIKGFTIQNSGAQNFCGGIITFANETTVIDNMIINNYFGIVFFPSILNKNQNSKSSFTPKNITPPDLFIETSKLLKIDSTSDHNTVIQNTISNNLIGVLIYYSSNNAIISNSFLQNIYGLLLFVGSNTNLISNNTFINDGLLVYNDTSSNLIINNTINNKPLLYLEAQSNMIITGDFGQIILAQCHNITIENQEINDTCVGIELLETTHCSLCSNTIESNHMVGVFLWNSTNNIISGNTLHANYGGILMWGEDNTVANNTITFNNGTGLSFSRSKNTTIVGNIISHNYDGISSGSDSNFNIKNNIISENTRGIKIYGNSELYNFIESNTIQFNTESGIEFYGVRNTILVNNTIRSNINFGIYTQFCENNIFLNNTLSYQQTGMIFYSSNNNYLLGNIITNNGKGIHLSNSDQNIIAGKNFIANNTYGIISYDGDSNTFSRNTLENNKDSGIEIYESNKNIIIENVIFLTRNLSNQTEGIRLYDSTDTIISDNTISNPAIGIKISYSSKSYILRNHISECDFEAVQCSSGSNNDVCGNILTRNGMGITISDAYYYTIEDNIITHTTGTGIDLSWSSDNTINRNNISLNKNGIIVRQTSTQNIFRGNIIERNQQTGIILLTETGDNTMSKNMILGNTVGINNSGYQNTVINNNISLNAVGVIVGYSSIHNILKENIIGENHETGIIILTDAAFTTITENVIQKNRLGITILGDYNTIDHNRILDNFYGINISYGSYNIISCNNLLANKQHASFQILFKNRFNRWNNNYWNQSRILPQPILGRMSWRNPIISIPWLTFDWHPARKPYDIL